MDFNKCVDFKKGFNMDGLIRFRSFRQSFLFILTYKKCIFSFVVIVLILTLIGTQNHYNVFDVRNNSPMVTSGKHRYTYSDEEVYSTIRRIRFNNCVRKHTRGQTCANLDLCIKFSERTAVSGCEDTADCQSAFDQNQTLKKMCKRRLPKAIIIGTYKSGTRELIDFLAMNPSVVIKRLPKYEVSYFDRQADKGLNWYRDQMPCSCQGQITIEKSPGYFISKEAPRRIFEMDKEIKLILIVRNPVDRTISHVTFEDYITREQYGNDIINCLYKYVLNERKINKNCFAIKASFYDASVERYLKYFALEQIYIIDASEFLKDPCAVLKKLEKFLKIEDYIDCDNFGYNREKGLHCVQEHGNVAPSCYGHNRGRLKSRSELGLLEGELETLFRSHNERFFDLVGKRFSWE